MESVKGSILFALMNGSGNVEACQNLANVLLERGYQIVFAADSITSQLIDKTSDYMIKVFDCQPLNDLSDQIDMNCLNGSPIEKVKNFGHRVITERFEFIRRCEQLNQKIIEEIRPELIIIESLVCSPVLTNSGIPWVWLNFGPPNLCRNDNRIPPGWSGLTIQKPTEFEEFKNEWKRVFADLKTRINNWCVSKGAPDLPDSIFHPHSPHLNFYIHPTELDYKLVKCWELKNWLQINCLLKRKTTTFVIPEALQSMKGKLIYLSMGGLASTQLMKRLISILSESQNKFIVSKNESKNRDEYELASNMSLIEGIPHNEVIPLVSLVITCGDNNIIEQSFINAKPMIVLPLFGDQLDNRSRLKETGFGWGLNPFTCNKETLICMIESTLADKPLARRLGAIAHSMNRTQFAKQMSHEIQLILNNNKQEQLIGETSLPIVHLDNQAEA